MINPPVEFKPPIYGNAMGGLFFYLHILYNNPSENVSGFRIWPSARSVFGHPGATIDEGKDRETVGRQARCAVDRDRRLHWLSLHPAPGWKKPTGSSGMPMCHRFVEYVPLDVHVGSIAIQRFIRERQPLLTLHGHVHESARLTVSWQEKIGRTYAFSAAHDGPELAIVGFNPPCPANAQRRLLG